jgi:hypothetical protein
MHSSPHLVVSISGHGFGHVAQTAPVLNLLHERWPELRLTVRSTVPLAHLRSRIHIPFDHLQSEGDIGMVMTSALDVNIKGCYTAYRNFHADWEQHVAKEAQLLRDIGADAVLSNVGYLPLAGAQRAGITNAALCSLNWLDIYRHYCGNDSIAEQMFDCYSKADVFLRATPGMNMSDLPNLMTVAPIAVVADDRRAELDNFLKASKDEKLVLVSMGGIATRLPMERWPFISGVRWLVQSNWQVTRPDCIALESIPMSFTELLASCDALLCKPGYGSFVESACSGTPVLYVNRPDWPESPALLEWLQQHGVSREIAREQLESGNIGSALSALWAAPKVTLPLSEGAAQVADWLMHKLSLSGD